MIARHDAQPDKTDIWSALAALMSGEVTPSAVRERLDAVVPGEWDLTLDLLPPVGEAAACFKARLQILGVIREHVGTGSTYRAAANGAFVASAACFGIGRTAEPAAGATDGAPPPPAARETRSAPAAAQREPAPARSGAPAPAPEPAAAPAPAAAQTTEQEPGCPKCGGRMWDNRLSKRNPKAPDFKCRDRSCDGVVWPPRDGKPAARGAKPDNTPRPVTAGGRLPNEPEDFADIDEGPLGDDDIPF